MSVSHITVQLYTEFFAFILLVVVLKLNFIPLSLAWTSCELRDLQRGPTNPVPNATTDTGNKLINIIRNKLIKKPVNKQKNV